MCILVKVSGVYLGKDYWAAGVANQTTLTGLMVNMMVRAFCRERIWP